MLLRELFEGKAKRIVAVMPGGFHPFHPGHKSLYDWAVKTFGKSNVYVAATNDTKARPFPFEVKKELAAMAGVPGSNFIQVKSPFNNREYADLLDDNTALVFVRSQKDKSEQPLPDQTKKNGELGYLRSYTGKDLNTADEMGYMAYGPTINFDFSGMQIKSASELRATWPEMSDEDKLKAAKLMYGNGAEVAVKLLDQALGAKEPEVAEDLKTAEAQGDNPAKVKARLNYLKKHPKYATHGAEKYYADKEAERAKKRKSKYDTQMSLNLEDVSPEDEDKFHNELDNLVHKYFGDSPDEEKMKKKMRKVKEGSPIEDLKKIVASKVYKKEYLMALKMMKQEAISAADAARRFMHVDARTLDAMAEKMGI
jgi:hypothetical protein